MTVQKSLGVCVGASTVSAVYLSRDHEGIRIDESRTIAHNGNPRKIISGLLKRNSIPGRIAVTGKKFRKFLNLTSISEAEAIETAVSHLGLSSDIIISAGGESFMIYVLDKNSRISKVCTGNKCASGTGEFFLQQIKRMDLDIEEAISSGQEGEPYNISGRCSVFCKSDCTHALNKGVAKENVVAGLAKMMAQKIIELTSRVPHESAIMIGGVSRNKAVMRFLKGYFDRVIVPEEAPYFEALGAAAFALDNETLDLDRENLFSEKHSPFTFHRPLKEFSHLVQFKEFNRGELKNQDNCILGLDVGSTTTKAVLLRKSDNAIVASEYLRTNGDPVKASIACYESLKSQAAAPVRITGLGVTGSGRHIAGLHALTKGIINEIIAHARATIYFDKDVDTIFEIGGQDAKYTHITSGVASDYAMNEACSAGTGSFLEEAAKESLDIDYKEIGEIALRAQNPPNFNDQCSAFISSDVKNALHEGLSKEDIVAGLVYSICMNYNNRVKGNRPVGKKVFMQGGVCYNKAVPVAMAALTGKEIIVPPEPGLMGAFGVALEIKHRLELGLIEEEEFSLDELIKRTVEYGKTFICAGGAEKCDRKCPVSLIRIDNKKYPFGGACNKYYNVQMNLKDSLKGMDLVKLREKLVFEKYIQPCSLEENAPSVGVSKSFLTNTLYPLYYNFFTRLGLRVVLSRESKTEGVDKREAAFCFPVELSHGFLQDLLDKKPDYIFLPQIKEIYNPGEEKLPRKTCVLMQSEGYYLKAAFKEELKSVEVLNPVLDFSEGYESAEKEFIRLAQTLGKTRKAAQEAYRFACNELNKMFAEFKQTGLEVLSELEQDPEAIAVVTFGRSYNAFAKEANLGVPQKFSSRGITVIPHDFLPYDDLESYKHMYWGLGQQILRGARFVHSHPQLFAAYITNFSCGPDSFIIPYFRNIMGRKPSLTLELDSHSADAGVNTRIEAALDIIKSYRELNKNEIISEETSNGFRALKVLSETKMVDSEGREILITDPDVNVVLSNMGIIGTPAFAAVFKHEGINATVLPAYNMTTLTTGRGNTTCKECLPLILNAGAMIEYYNSRRDKNEKTLYFMPKGDGPCRLGQYHVYLEDIVKKRKMRNFAVYTLSDENSYEGLGNSFVIRGWAAITIGNLMTEIYNCIQALAVDRESASDIFNEEYEKVLKKIEGSTLSEVYKQLERSALVLNAIERKESIHEARKVVIVGEIFVRHEDFSRMDLVERLIERGFVVRIIPVGEYIYYSNYLAAKENTGGGSPAKDKLRFTIRDYTQKYVERKIRKMLAKSGFIEYDMPDINDILKRAEHLVSRELSGEAILTIGSALREIMDHVSGVISLGPFGCMPSRVAEAILNVEMNTLGKLVAEKKKIHMEENEDLPFLAIETDGNIFPQIIQSKIEIFMLQAERLHEKLRTADKSLADKYKEAFYKLVNNVTGSAGKETTEVIPDLDGIISEAD